MRKYTIVKGYWAAEGEQYKADFFDIWYHNTMKYCKPEAIYVLNVASKVIPREKYDTKWIDFTFNLGHAHHLDKNDYPHKKIGGWSMSFMMGCLLAYSNDSDLIFKEQDCLGFNNWVAQLYADAKSEDVSAVVGRQQDATGQILEQSCFLVKHELLLPFLVSYISVERNDGGPGFLRTEGKFRYVMDNFLPGKIGHTTMGYGRARPDKFDKDENFYMQKIQPHEVKQLCELGLLDTQAVLKADSKCWEH